MAPRRSNSTPRRNPTTSGSGGKKGGSLVTGLFIGLVAGLVAAAGIAWYLSSKTPEFKSVETDLPRGHKSDISAAAKPEGNSKPVNSKPAATENRAPAKPETTESPDKRKPAPPEKPAKTAAEPTVSETASPIKPRVDYTFYGILPGDQPAKPVPLPVSKDIWWLQVAALKNPADADKLKARLILLGLEVATQKVDSGSGPLYRVRVGPYQREDDAFGDLDTLAENNFEPRLFKEPNPPAATVKEKP